MTPLTWQVFFSPTAGHQRTVQQWMTENAPFFQTQEGAAFLAKINHIKGQYINNEKWYESYGKKAGRGNDYNKRKNELVEMFKATRTNIQTSPTNPATQPPVGNAPTGTPGNAPGAPAPGLTTAPPVYLPTVNAPQYMFPSAESVKDMTYDPGIGGFLRPNQWQSGVPATPYGGDNRPPGSFNPGPGPGGYHPGNYNPYNPPGNISPIAPTPPGQPFGQSTMPVPGVGVPPGQPYGQSTMPVPGVGVPPGQPYGQSTQGQFPWQPGY